MSSRRRKTEEEVSQSSASEAASSEKESSSSEEEEESKSSQESQDEDAIKESERQIKAILAEKLKLEKVKISEGSFDSLNIFRIRLAQAYNLTSNLVAIVDRDKLNLNEQERELYKSAIWKFLGKDFVPVIFLFSNRELLKKLGVFREDEDVDIKVAYIKMILDPELSVPSEVEVLFNEWKNEFLKIQERDANILKSFDEVKNKLRSLEKLKMSDPIPYRYKERYYPRLKLSDLEGKYSAESKVIEIEPSHWIEIVDQSNPNSVVPLIFGRTSEKIENYQLKGFTVFASDDKRQNIESGLVWDQTHDLDIIPEVYKCLPGVSQKILNEMKTGLKEKRQYNTIISILNIGGRPSKMTYIIAPGVESAKSLHGFSIETNSREVDMRAILERTFPNLMFDESVAISTSAIFTISGVKLNEAILFDMIRRDPLMKYFLRIRETKTPYTFKKKPYFFFQHWADRFLPAALRSEEEATINMNQISLEKGGKIEIILTISRVEQAILIAKILNRLFVYYMEQQEKIEKLMNCFVKEIPAPIEVKKERMKTLVSSHSIFDSDYFDIVPPARRPVIISDPETDSLTFYNNDGKKLFNFACANEEFPIPSLRKNPNPNSEYRKVPYCRRRDEVDDEIPRDRNTAPLKAVAGTRLGREAEIPNQIKTILERIIPGELAVLGNLEGYDSLIACLLLAVKDPIMNKSNPIKSIRKLRSRLGNFLSPEALIQENWKYTNEEILRDLHDPDTPFESRRFYRALELRFGVKHLYLFFG